MTNFPWLTTMLLPLVGAAVVFALPAGLADRAKHVALGFSGVTLLLTIAAALQFEVADGEQFGLVEQHEWIPQFGVSYALGVDGFALPLLERFARLLLRLAETLCRDLDRVAEDLSDRL